MLPIARFSLGVGDRFARQARAQLEACILAREAGVQVTPVWNKSHREHLIVGSHPAEVRAAADRAVREAGWDLPYFVDADHVRLETVEWFLASSDFFTIDVADSIGALPAAGEVEAFVGRHPELCGRLEIPDLRGPLPLGSEAIREIARKYLAAVAEAGRIYRKILAEKTGDFATEVSMDETDAPQSPGDLLVILAALADEGVPVRTIAPKFTGRFNKGVDYAGDVDCFTREFSDDLAVIRFAVGIYGLPADLRLSIHSGSDKFSLYPRIRRILRDTGAGVHLKTAGTTWLEELIGLAEGGPAGLALAKEVYCEALDHREALCAPYASVIDVDPARLPPAGCVLGWSAGEFVGALRHVQGRPEYNPSLRQLLHVGYKVAAQMGDRYLSMLDSCRESISRNVTLNLYERHVRAVFPGLRGEGAGAAEERTDRGR